MDMSVKAITPYNYIFRQFQCCQDTFAYRVNPEGSSDNSWIWPTIFIYHRITCVAIYYDIAAVIALGEVICSPDDILMGLLFDTAPAWIQAAMNEDCIRGSIKDPEVSKELLMLFGNRIEKNVVWERHAVQDKSKRFFLGCLSQFFCSIARVTPYRLKCLHSEKP